MAESDKELITILDGVNIDKSYLWKARIDMAAAMVFALQKHGRPTSNPNRGISTLSEELGEAAEHAIEATRPDLLDGIPDPTALRQMYDELAQLAGYAMLLMMSMRKLYKDVEDGAYHGE
jgi:NTP pyrophosphatase (non-canonical NTP hydrolase)